MLTLMPPGRQPDTLATLRRNKSPLARPAQPNLFPAEIESPHLSEMRIWSVGALVSDIRVRTESAYSDVWVEGEVSNLRPAPSGHIYFTLKDGEAQLPVVVFRRQAILLRFQATDGLAVLVRGRVSVYESRGQLQLIAETIEPRGAGALQLAFEQLKRRLANEGLFDSDRKQPLPAFPHCIGIITSPTGAVLRDIVNVVRRRHARLNLVVYPALMQGSACCSSVAAGIRYFNIHPELADVILLARGGGSIEDLAGFNEESLARVIAASTIPIVSAIGHETDFTIADFVADLRAPTPSAAAEIVTSAQHRVEDRVHSLITRLDRAIRFRLIQARQNYAVLSADSVFARLRESLYRREQRLDEFDYRLEAAARDRLRTPANRLAGLVLRLDRETPSRRFVAVSRRLDQARASLNSVAQALVSIRADRLAHMTTRLQALSPLAVLNRGYALVYAETGALVRDAEQTVAGQKIFARLATGSLTATVVTISPETTSR